MREFIVFLAFVGPLPATADDKPTGKTAPPAKVDWGAYSDHIKVAGVVAQVRETGFTLNVLKGVSRGRPPKPQYESLDLQYHEFAQVRVPKLPPKMDETRKKLNYTDKEIAALRLPAGMPGYSAEKAGLKDGARVEVQLLKPKGVAAGKLVTSDYKIKYVTILDPGTLPVKK